MIRPARAVSSASAFASASLFAFAFAPRQRAPTGRRLAARRSTLVALALAFALASPARAAPELARGPVLVGVSADTAYVTWETTTSQSGAAVLLGTVSGQHPRRVEEGLNTGPSHHVKLDGLSPATRYFYVVDSAPGEESSFTTAPEPVPRGSAHVRFVVYGDNRSDAAAHQSVVDAILKEPGLDFLVHTGDLAQNYPGSAEWNVFFGVEHDLLRSRPFYVSLGNHETLDTLATWGVFFAWPTFQVTHPIRYFGLDWGPVHLALLDSYDGTGIALDGDNDNIGAAQLEWLKEDLAAARRRGAIPFVALHRGAWSHAVGPGAHGPSLRVRAGLMPELQARGVLAVFAGHDHIYEHGCHGDVDSFVAGGGGAPLYAVDAGGDPGVLSARSALSYTVIDVQGLTVTGQTKAPDGTLLESFSLPSAGCNAGQLAPFEGPPDAGEVPVDAGSPPPPGPTSSCGSTGPSAAPWLLAALALALGVASRRTRRPRLPPSSGTC